jgi:hypothetical protein
MGRRLRRWLQQWCWAGLLLAGPMVAHADDGPLLAVQGFLRSNAGTPVPDGDYALAVVVWDAAVGGNPLFEQDFLAVPVNGGLFNLELGSKKSPMAASLFNGSPRWLGVTIGANPELPRVALRAVPQALWATAAGSLQCSGCIDGSQLAAASVQAAHVAFAYAGSDSKGGAALAAKLADSAKVAEMAKTADSAKLADIAKLADAAKSSETAKFAQQADAAVSAEEAKVAKALQCTGCVTAAMLGGNVAADLVAAKQLAPVAVTGKFSDLQGGPDLSGYAKLAGDNGWLGVQSFGKDVQFNKQQALLFRFQNAGADPTTCDASAVGVAYFNTANQSLVVCNGKQWQPFAKVGGLGTEGQPAASCKALFDAGQSTDGVYWLQPAPAVPAFQAWCDLKNGGWTLVLKTSSKSAWGYSHAVWTASDDASGQIPKPTDDVDAVSRAFYKLAATSTRACIARYDGGQYACETVNHGADTARNLANSGPLGSSQGTNNLLTATWKSITAGGVWGAYAWHRFGWNTGTSSHGGVRFGFTADNDSSDSQDSAIGFGLHQQNAPSITAGAGYYQYPWNPQPNPATAVLQGQIWMK